MSFLVELLVLLFIYVITPMAFCCFRIAVLCLTNTFFYSKRLSACLHMCFLPTAAIVIGLVNHTLFYSFSYVAFAAVTSVAFTFALHVSILASKAYNLATADIPVRFFLVFYSMIGLRLPFVQENFDDYLLLYIVMCMKLLCCAEDIDKNRYEILMELHGGFHIQTFEVGAYFFYSGWISYRDFTIISKKIKERKYIPKSWFGEVKFYFFDEIWYSKPFHSTVFKTVLLCLVSQEYISIGTGVFWGPLTVLLQGIQFRCKYYLLCQYSQFERVTSALKKNSWHRNTLYNLKNAESSVALQDLFSSFSLPINGYIRRKFNSSTFEGQSWNLVHYAFLCFILGSYDGYYALLFALFLLGFFSQRNSLECLSTHHNTCLFSCNHQICRHPFGRNHKGFHLLRAGLIILMNMRFALILPVVPAYDIYGSLILVCLGLIFDVYLVIAVLVNLNANPEPGQLVIKRSRLQRRRQVSRRDT